MQNNELRAKNLEKRSIQEKKLQEKQLARERKSKLHDEKQKQFADEFSKKKDIRIKAAIAKVEKKYTEKIKLTEEKLKALPKELEAEEKDKLKDSSLVKYIEFRIKTIKTKYAKKVEAVKNKMEIAKITKEEAEAQIRQLEIDEGSVYERWDKLLVKAKDNTSAQKLKNKIIKYERLMKSEIEALEKRNKSTPASNMLQAAKVMKADFKAKAIFGVELSVISDKISAHIRRYSMFYILAIIICIFAMGTNGHMFSSESFMNIMRNNTYIMIIGLGMLLVIVGGYIDLSVGSLLGFMGAESVLIYNNFNGNILLTLIFVVLMGAAIGFCQGVLIGYLKMPAFIVTLGTMLLFQGLILTVTKSMTILPLSDYNGDSGYVDFVLGAIPDVVIGSNIHVFGLLIVLFLGVIAASLMLIGRSKKAKYGLATDSTLSMALKVAFIIALFTVVALYVGKSIFGLQYYLIYIMALVVIFIFITQNTSFGRKVYAMGGNKKAAELSGINTARTTVYIFMITGALVGFAAIVFTAISSNAAPDVSTRGYELDVISSVFVGGASMAGGIGTIPGTFIGALILGYINIGMFEMEFKTDMQKIIKAAVLLGAVGYDIYSNRKMG